ncbi:MAG TPA: cytochrome P450 [Streptosporangiaceae bacterium]
MTALDIDLSNSAFWGRPLAEREMAFAELRARARPAFFPEPDSPFGQKGPGYYALVKHADVTEASRHPEVFCSGRGATQVPDVPDEFNEYFGSMINMDDPRHARLRRIVSRSFTPKMIKKFEDDVQRTAGQVVTELLEAGPCDFVQRVATRLPLKIICDMMGISDTHYDMVLHDTNVILAGFDTDLVSEDLNEALGQIMTSAEELRGLVTDLGSTREGNPTDDLVSALVNANIDGERLTTAELASFFILLVVAGNETTRNAISHALWLLTQHEDQRALLLSGLERRLPGAVEEIVRCASPVIFMRRTLTRDYTLNGVDFAKDDKVILTYWAANRDESVFTGPGRFDITRHPNPHVGFGGPGPHFCLGAHLARREITVMLRELLSRVPDIRASGEPDRLLSAFINGIKRLPCEFSA